MGALQRIGQRLLETVEDRTGREIVPADRVEILESAESDNRVLRKTLEFIGFSLLNFQSAPQAGRMPRDMTPLARIASAAQAQRAWIEDPMAGQQVDLYVSFVFGRGVPRPQAHDDEVQDVLDRTWDDSANKRILTSFDKLVEKGVDACIQSNVFFTFFDDGQDGMVRVSLLTFEDVQDAIRHPVDKYRILYYKALERTVAYDFANGRYVVPVGKAGAPKIVYYEAWDAFDDDDPVMAAQDAAAGDGFRPPESMLRPGKVVHLALNKTSDMAFGVPRMRRLLRWFTAYNETLESHVNRMKAMASVYMKATVKGTQRDLDRLGQMAMGRRSAFGASQEVAPGAPPAAGPVGPGVLGQNEALNYEPFKIDSGAGDVSASAPIMRGQFSGAFPDSYMSGTSQGGVAGDQALELPTLKFIEREQEAWADVFRKLGQSAVDAAIRVGDLTEWRDPTDEEQAAIVAAEQTGEPLHFEVDEFGQVKRDLGFEVSLPSPLKRAMGDLVTAAVTTATAVDPNATNPELSRWLFGFILAEAFDVEDPQRIVDQVLPRHLAVAAAAGDLEIDPTTGQPIQRDAQGRPIPADTATITGPDGRQHPADNPGGGRVAAPQPEDRRVQEAAVTARGRRRAAMHASRARRREVTDAFDEDVAAVASEHLKRLGDVPALAAEDQSGTT